MVNIGIKPVYRGNEMFSRIDHIAVLVPKMDDAIQLYSKSFGVDFLSRERNEEQGFEVVVFKVGDAFFELLSPTRSDSVIAGMLEKRGPGIHHIGLEVEDVKNSMEILRASGLHLTSEEPKRGEGDSLICFIHPKNLLGTMLELVEHPEKHQQKRSKR
jgi:methylmalonyl-CoA/ethylmalonyl-CoA epimerase